MKEKHVGINSFIDDLEDEIDAQEKTIGELKEKIEAMKPDGYMAIEKKILAALDNCHLSQVVWEGNEDVLTFNDKPIGGTI